MSMDTEELVRRLAHDVEPVRPLPGPWIRTVEWLALAVPYVVLVVVVMSPRVDLTAKMSDWRFVLEQFAAMATATAGAVAAFATVIPGHNRKFLLLPLLTLSIWLGSLGYGLVQEWAQSGRDGLPLRPDWICMPAIVLAGLVPAIAIVVMLRRGAPLTPRATLALAGLAAAGLGNLGMRLFHQHDEIMTVLVWQFGTVVMVSALAGWTGHYFLSWRHGAVRRRVTLG